MYWNELGCVMEELEWDLIDVETRCDRPGLVPCSGEQGARKWTQIDKQAQIDKQTDTNGHKFSAYVLW